jgi:hypothetical protein
MTRALAVVYAVCVCSWRVRVCRCIHSSTDFLGVNHYSTNLVYFPAHPWGPTPDYYGALMVS